MSDLREHIEDVLKNTSPVKDLEIERAFELYEAAELLIDEIEAKLPGLEFYCDDMRLKAATLWTAYRKREVKRDQYRESKLDFERTLNEVNMLKARLGTLQEQRAIALRRLQVRDHGVN